MEPNEPNLDHIARYLYEMGYLKRLRRSGWWRIGVDNPESVAAHSFRVAVIGFILAALDGADPERTASICLFHDAAETRIGDIPWVARRYVASREAEQLAFREQIAQLPGSLGERILHLFHLFQERGQQCSREAELARDADLLECLLQAKEYSEQGYSKGMEWARICRDGLKSNIARELADACLTQETGSWFENLQENPHTGDP